MDTATDRTNNARNLPPDTRDAQAYLKRVTPEDEEQHATQRALQAIGKAAQQLAMRRASGKQVRSVIRAMAALEAAKLEFQRTVENVLIDNDQK